MTEPARPQRIHSRTFFEALIAAGVIRKDDYCRRIVIDVQVNEAVKIYAERYADERLLDVVMTLDGIEIRRQERQPA